MELQSVAGSITNPLLANSRWFNRIPTSQVHFMIENVRQFLDAPGEYFFDQDGPRPDASTCAPRAASIPMASS